MRVSPCPLPSVVASSSYTVSAEGYPDYTANAITSDEAAAAYREAAAGDADGSGNVGGTSTASQMTTVSSNDIASTEHEFLVLGLIPKVKNTITLTITDTDGNATTRTIEQTGPKLLGEEEVRSNRPSPPTNPRSPCSAMACTRFSAMIPTSRISCTTMTRTV